MELKEKLVTLRKEKGLTQLAVAEKLDVSRQAISRWESGVALPSTDNLKSLSTLYGVPVDYLLNSDIEREHKEVCMKRTLCLLLCVVMIFSITTTVSATEIEDTVVSENRISRAAIESILSRETAQVAMEATNATTAISRERVYDVLAERDALLAERRMAENGAATRSVAEIERDLLLVEEEVEQLPVIELTASEVAALIGTPTVPNDTDVLRFEAVPDRIRASNGKYYDVFSIRVSSKIVDADGWEALFDDGYGIELLGEDTYTKNEFKKILKFAFSSAVSAGLDKLYSGSSLVAGLIDPDQFFGSTSTQSLKLNYIAQSTFFYTYVAEDNVDWYDFMQTSESMYCDFTMIAYSSDYRPQDDEDVWRRTFEVNDPDYFENPEPAVERYAEGDITHYGYPLGTKKVYYNNVHKHTIGLAYYNELASIPGW